MSSTQTNNTEKKSKKKGKSPAFQFYPRDFLCDGKVLAMPLHMRGAYITLLCIDWIDDGLLESDFATLSGLGDDGGETTQLRRCFVPHPTKEGYLTNPRLLKERENQQDRKSQAENAAAKRWHSPSNANDDAQNMQAVCTTSASTSASTSAKKKREKRESATPILSPAVIGDAPTKENPRLPEKLREEFIAAGLVEESDNIFVKPGTLEKLKKQFGEGLLWKGVDEIYRWSVSTDINPKTKKPGWYSYRLKRDHEATLVNQIRRIQERAAA